MRDRILGDIRAKHNLGKQAKSHQIAKQAIDQFIEATKSYTMESVTLIE